MRALHPCGGLLCAGLLIAATCTALVDDASSLNFGEFQNIILSDGAANVTAFNGDTSRFVRASSGEAAVSYSTDVGFRDLEVAFFSYLPTDTWKIDIIFNGESVHTLSGRQVSDSLDSTSDEPSQVEDGVVSWQLDPDPVDGWARGLLSVDVSQISEQSGCQISVTIEISGGDDSDFWSLQLGSVRAADFESKEACRAVPVTGPTDGAEACFSNTDTCSELPESAVRTYFDEAEATAHMFQTSNVRIATDRAQDFDGDANRFARSDNSLIGQFTYRADTGGIYMLRFKIAVNLLDQTQQHRVYVSVRPYTSPSCKPAERRISMREFTTVPLAGGWEMGRFDVGPFQGAACELPRFVEVDFFAPEQSDVQIMSMNVVTDGSFSSGFAAQYDGLPRGSDGDGGDDSGGIDMLYIYIAVGVAGVFLLGCIGTTWYCCCCTKAARKQAELEQYKQQQQQQVLVPVDCVVHEDSPKAAAEESRANPVSDRPRRPTRAPQPPQPGQPNIFSFRDPAAEQPVTFEQLEPPVPLPPAVAVPTGANHGANHPRLTSLRREVVDTMGNMSGYQSNDEPETSGPFERISSYPNNTNNPCETGRTSLPSQASGLGVSAQLEERVIDFKQNMADQAGLRLGQAATDQADIKLLRKIGYGGFGAVYEAEWQKRVVAVKVIKMQDFRNGEETARDKMAMMETAISGILLHANIVQTYYADVRPIFMEETAASGPVSGWTELQDYLSNDRLDQQYQQAARISEWEVRLVMEYCNKGNLKEAIRAGSLMHNGRPLARSIALLALDIAKGCQAIHRHGIIHGDLKPHNVLLTVDSDDVRGWIGKIADFGLSVKISRGQEHVSGIQHGTEGYVAPEVLQTRRMKKESDVYSFGILLWELWHSRLYYEEYRNAVKRMGKYTLDYRPTFERGCPEDWASLAKLCWSANLIDRPDFKRVVKRMEMIVTSIEASVGPDGTLA